MKRILILGCGRSSSNLIKYLLESSERYQWQVRVGDEDEKLAQQKVGGYGNASFFRFNVFNETLKDSEIQNSDLVISMLPAGYHIDVLKSCIRYRKNMLSASYITDEVKSLSSDIKEKGILVIKECGLDPGLDHMSAMKIIDGIRSKGGELVSFKSYAGGLVAPESDNNPWGYKITWNPRNVVLAGQGTARYLQNGTYKYIPYHRLFLRTENIKVAGWGDFEGYANRDSLSYRKIYGIDKIPTILRGTLRRPGFCKAWHVFVQLGLTDDSFTMETESMSYRAFLDAFLPINDQLSIEEKLSKYTGVDEHSKEMILWLGLLEDEKIGIKNASPAKVLQQLIEKKWLLEPHDKDMIVMQHQFEYLLGGKKHGLLADLVVVGDGPVHTAMSKTVGLPLAIVSKLILTEKIKLTGLHIPVLPEIYEPVLNELKEFGVVFKDREILPI